ncbi:spore germination protein KB [Lentibacillus persicus]|uniref:Spore germination protein KB n=1 Tax=Lentibacillus persicus TaxID=640948 RepID=A0A1I1SAG1_9BACI|nr:endospore germination permease [Lentibacillus persicus]SFD39980.1 spore germination protein KB [Lentibacillus persicus]
MIENGRISVLQMAILVYPTIIATAILLLPAITGDQAKQDMWLSPIWASAAGFLAVFLAIRLNNRFPDMTIIQYSEVIVGKFLGKAIGLLFILFLAHNCGVTLREYGEFVKGNFLEDTPLAVIIGSMIFICALAVRGGIEVMARSAQVFVPVVTVLFIVVLLLLIPDITPGNVQPVFKDGIMPSLKGATVAAGWFLEFFVIAFMLPFLRNRKKSAKWSIITVVAVIITMVVTNLVTLFIFGALTPTFTYPVMEAARYISIAEFIQHMESVVMAIWVGGIFIKISVLLYITVLSTAQWVRLSDYRPIVFPYAFIIGVLGHWSAENVQELEKFLKETFPIYALLFLALLPTMLLVTAAARGLRSQNTDNRTSSDASAGKDRSK